MSEKAPSGEPLGSANSITFLGTAGDLLVASRHLRNSGGIVITSGSSQIHLDPGPGALARALQCRINSRDTNILLVSHHHFNHSAGIPELIAGMTLNGLDKRGIMLAHSSMKDSISSYEKSLLDNVLFTESGTHLNESGVHIKTTPVKGHEGMGFIVQTNSMSIGYTSDTEYSQKLADEMRDCTLLVVNCQNPPGEKEKGRMNVDDAIHLVQEASPKLAVFTHFGIKMLDKDHLEMARTIQKASGVQTLLAKDGLSIDPLNYSAHARQKNLHGFVSVTR